MRRRVVRDLDRAIRECLRLALNEWDEHFLPRLAVASREIEGVNSRERERNLLEAYYGLICVAFAASASIDLITLRKYISRAVPSSPAASRKGGKGPRIAAELQFLGQLRVSRKDLRWVSEHVLETDRVLIKRLKRVALSQATKSRVDHLLATLDHLEGHARDIKTFLDTEFVRVGIIPK